MHIHILGICGTFMGGIAAIARAAGHRVTGCDANVYPPMSTQLASLGIDLHQGFDTEQIERYPADVYVVGNAMTRGMPVVEAILDRGLAYASGPQWLAENVLHGKWVLGVAGTHGKTTTASMLAWILEFAGLDPGFLIGGVPSNFGISARLAGRNRESPFFVVEADEYDTAFFDKRSKFVWYRPRTAVLNNLEYDHADIFPDLAAIETQFHHLVRTIPGNGLIVANGDDANLARALARGAWTPVEYFGAGRRWDYRGAEYAEKFEVFLDAAAIGGVDWPLCGAHNVMNALAAVAAARHAGVPPRVALDALGRFAGVKRRMELRGEVGGISVYDDFAHHPTAIRETVAGLRARVGNSRRIIIVVEPRTNTMKLGVMRDALPASLAGADRVFCLANRLGWDACDALRPLGPKAATFESTEAILDALLPQLGPGDSVVFMSNGGFEDIHSRLLDRLEERHA